MSTQNIHELDIIDDFSKVHWQLNMLLPHCEKSGMFLKSQIAHVGMLNWICWVKIFHDIEFILSVYYKVICNVVLNTTDSLILFPKELN